MSAIAVIGAKMSNNQHRVDQSWDWLKRVWMAWAVINGIGALYRTSHRFSMDMHSYLNK